MNHCTHIPYGHKGACQSKADLLLSRTVDLQSSPGCVTVTGQSVDVLQPLHGDSRHLKYLYATILFLIVLRCMYEGAWTECGSKTSQRGRITTRISSWLKIHVVSTTRTFWLLLKIYYCHRKGCFSRPCHKKLWTWSPHLQEQDGCG